MEFSTGDRQRQFFRCDPQLKPLSHRWQGRVDGWLSSMPFYPQLEFDPSHTRPYPPLSRASRCVRVPSILHSKPQIVPTRSPSSFHITWPNQRGFRSHFPQYPPPPKVLRDVIVSNLVLSEDPIRVSEHAHL